MYKFNVYPDGTGFSVDLVFTTAKNTLVEKRKAFFNFNRTTVLLYAHNHFREWLNERFTKYVHHAEILSYTGKIGFYNTTSRTNSLARLKDFSRVSERESTRGLVLRILNLEQDLRNVLPASTNHSYQSSHDRVEDMIEQCRRYRKVFIKSAL